MDDRPHQSHSSSTKQPSSHTHHTPIHYSKHDEVADASFVVPLRSSTMSPHSTYNKAGLAPSHATFFPSNDITPSAIATVSPSPPIPKLPNSTTPSQSNRNLDQPSTTNTATPIGQSSHNNNTAGILGPVLGVVTGIVVVVCGLLWIFLRRRKQNQLRQRLDSSPPSSDNDFNHQISTMERGGKNVMMMAGHDSDDTFPASPSSAYYSKTSLQQPPMSRDAKRLTADTLISVDQRSSLSTMVSKKQYTPQLAYSPQGIDKNDLLCVSPSNTLIDGFSTAAEDDEKRQQQQLRVPSYQPQIVMDTNSDMQNYYDYLSTTNSNDDHSMINEQQQQQPREHGHQ